MSLVRKEINNLLGGVSQQTPAMRLDSQADRQTNAFTDPVLGVYKRPGTLNVARLLTGVLSKPKIHTINRDQREQYQVVITDGDLKVFDLQGNERTVSFPNGKDYLRTADPRSDIKTLTVQDYTFIVNRGVRPSTAVTPYLTTDQVSATVNFGSGDESTAPGMVGYYEGELIVDTVPPGHTISYPNTWIVGGTGYSVPFANSLNEAAQMFWDYYNADTGGSLTQWGINIDYPNYSAFYSDFVANATIDAIVPTGTPVYGTSLNGFNTGIIVRASGINLKAGPFTGGSGTLRFYLNLIPAQWFPPPVPIPTALLGAVDSPAPFVIPIGGTSSTIIVMPFFEGDLVLTVNGRRFSHPFNASWSATEYANYFAAEIQNAFPTLNVQVNNGWQLFIQAPQGEQLYVSSYNTQGNDVIRTVYSELPKNDSLFVVIKNGVQEQNYAVSINGSLFQYTAPASPASAYTAESIANNLAGQMNAGGLFQAAVFGNVIQVRRVGGGDMTFTTKDTWNNQAMYAMKNRIQAAEDLPLRFLPGIPIEIVGVDGRSGYYVHYTLENVKPPKAYGLERQVTIERPDSLITPAGNTWNAIEGAEQGLWEECAKPGVPDKFIPHTMPHVLISLADGTFEFRPVEWYRRTCGDNDSVPTASIEGHEIRDVFFHRNRLGFLTEETLVMSRSGEFFNLWPSTAREVFDTDPIDIQVNHTKVAKLNNTATYNNLLLIFSDNTQFALTSADILSPRTAAVRPSTSFEVSRRCQPKTIGQYVYFVSSVSGTGRLMEYFPDTNNLANDAITTNEHAPRYIPEDVSLITPSTSKSVLVLTADSQPNRLVFYRWLWANEGKSLSAFYEAFLPTNAVVLNTEFIEEKLWITTQYPDGVYLEYIDLEEVPYGSMTYSVHLDRRVVSTGTPQSGKWFHAGIPWGSTPVAVRVDNGFIDANLEPTTGGWLSSYQTLIMGVPFEFDYTLSRVYPKNREGAPIIGANMMLRSVGVKFEDTVEFEMVITPNKRSPQVNRYTTATTGIAAMLGTISPKDGEFKRLTAGAASETEIKFRSNSPWPCYFQSVALEANYTNRANTI